MQDGPEVSQPSNGRAGKVPLGIAGQGLRLQAGQRGELGGPHPHPALAERRDIRIPELGQAVAS